MKTMYKIMNALTLTYIVITYYILGFAVHVYTCYSVYESYGFFLGLIAFFSPIVSTIIMFILYLIFYGIFSQYCIIVLIYIGLVAFSFVLSYITTSIEKNIKE